MDDKDSLGEDDNELWQVASSEFEPLKNKKPTRFLPEYQKTGQAKKKTEIKITTIIPAPLPLLSQKTKHEFLEVGDMSHVDGSIAKKLKEGSYPIDVRLDLHGRTQDEAFEALRYCVSTAYSLGKRCILVITGKGEQGKGILRGQLPKWLATSGLKEYILAINHANHQHGGSGAFYVLLRKNR